MRHNDRLLWFDQPVGPSCSRQERNIRTRPPTGILAVSNYCGTCTVFKEAELRVDGGRDRSYRIGRRTREY